MLGQHSTAAVARLTGASLRQLGYWDRSGLLKPSGQLARGRGSRRRYSFRDIVAAKTICSLRTQKIPLQMIRLAVRYLKNNYPANNNAEMLARLVLLSDGKNVYMLTDARQVMNVLTRQMGWFVPIGKLVLETQQYLESLPQQWVQPVTVAGRAYHLDFASDPEAGGFTVQGRELPGAIEQGETAAEAIANGTEAIRSVLAFLAKRKAAAKGIHHVALG